MSRSASTQAVHHEQPAPVVTEPADPDAPANGLREVPATTRVPVEDLLDRFQSVSLAEVDKTSGMLKRIDNKYLIDFGQLSEILEPLSEQFQVLVIDGVKVFSYESCYFDDALSSFHEHHRGTRNRVKVRRRHYVDSGKVFFEVKLKGKRGSTNKLRSHCSELLESALSIENLSVLEDFYQKTYRKAFGYRLDPSLIVGCKRISLASKQGGERVTIDFDLRFETIEGQSIDLGPNLVIVEAKSPNGRGAADRILKANQIRRVKRCSKYCIGQILSGNVKKYNNFRPLLKLILNTAAPLEA